MKIVHVAVEMAPLAKVGGLGDMVGGLCKDLAKLREDVEVILPNYSFLKTRKLPIECHSFKYLQDGKLNRVCLTKLDNLSVALIDHKKKDYFHRPNIYGYSDDAERFVYFSCAALEYLLEKKETIDILHVHDWHTSICAVLYKEVFEKKGLKIKKIVLNIHNVEYQGICCPGLLDIIGLESKKHLTNGCVNLLKEGIIHSDAIIAVSPTYAKEILTKENGYGLEGVLKANEKKILGILNGIDYTVWNPKTDKNIFFRYSPKDRVEKIMKIKAKNKKALRKELGLEIEDKPLICSVGRLVYQKGPELIEHAINSSVKHDAQFVLLGSTHIEELQKKFSNLESKYKKHKDISINFTYDEKLAHQIYASSDFIIIPSLFEPCGLTQMIALSYGTIPIVRKTGGLADTIFDVDEKNKTKNGFTFYGFNKKELDEALERALRYWNQNGVKLQKLIKSAVSSNHSLSSVAKEYLGVYKKLIS